MEKNDSAPSITSLPKDDSATLTSSIPSRMVSYRPCIPPHISPSVHPCMVSAALPGGFIEFGPTMIAVPSYAFSVPPNALPPAADHSFGAPFYPMIKADSWVPVNSTWTPPETAASNENSRIVSQDLPASSEDSDELETLLSELLDEEP